MNNSCVGQFTLMHRFTFTQTCSEMLLQSWLTVLTFAEERESFGRVAPWRYTPINRQLAIATVALGEGTTFSLARGIAPKDGTCGKSFTGQTEKNW